MLILLQFKKKEPEFVLLNSTYYSYRKYTLIVFPNLNYLFKCQITRLYSN